MSREPQFTFSKILMDQDPMAGKVFTVSLSKGVLAFQNAFLRLNQLEGRYIEFFADESKRAIAFKVLAPDFEPIENLKKTPIRKINMVGNKGKTGICSIGRILDKTMMYQLERQYFQNLKLKGIPIMEVEQKYVTNRDATMWYFRIPRQEGHENDKLT